MLLLVTSSPRAKDCAAALEGGNGQPTAVATSVPHALSKLQAGDFEAVVIDQSLLETDIRGLDRLLNHCGTAMPVYVNLALHGCDRVVREVQVALRRAATEKLIAEQLAGKLLRNELRNEVTGILLNSELALRQVGVGPEITQKLKSVRELAEKMRSRLEIR